MGIQIVACQTLRDELQAVMAHTGCRYPVSWIESGLHNVPVKLKKAVQSTLDALPGEDDVLLAMGFCGNALSEITSGGHRLIVPRVDDCISLLLGSCTERGERYKSCYFMTSGWLRGERNIWVEYQYTTGKYGKETGDAVFQTMFGNYRDLALLDTGCYDMEKAECETRRICQALKLQYRVIPGTTRYLEQLLTGPWPDELFLTVPAHTRLAPSSLRLSQCAVCMEG